MGPILYDHFSKGPTMILPTSRNHPSFQFPAQSMQGLQAYESGSWSMDAVCAANQLKAPTHHSSSWTPASSAKTIFTNPSRKRSRNDSEDVDFSVSKPNVASPAPAVQVPIYGEGMVLLNPGTGMAVSADSQTGTWYEAEAAKKAGQSAPTSSRLPNSTVPDGPSRKSQRLDTSAPGIDDVELAWIRHQMSSTTNDDNRRSLGKNSPFTMANEPQVDDVTLLLGISWQRVSHDDDMAPAVSGWEKYINNHFYNYMRNARIILKNRSLNAYLVAALPAHDIRPQGGATPTKYPNMSTVYQFDPASYFFLFKEDLNEGQLVASTPDNCLENIQSTPIQFEGTGILRASERSPERSFAPDQTSCGIPIARISKEDRGGSPSERALLNHDMAMSMGVDMDLDL